MKPTGQHVPRFTRDLWLSVATLIVVTLAFGAYVYAEKQIDRAND